MMIKSSSRVFLRARRHRRLATSSLVILQAPHHHRRPPPSPLLHQAVVLENRCFSSTTAAATTNEDNSKPSDNGDKPQSSTKEDYAFQAETRQLLDIVTNSLYEDKDVFLRELVSNASDACEKLRHLQVTNSDLLLNNEEEEVPLEIRIQLDEVASSITISDTGIGMTKQDMIDNLGTIARSGSKNFLKQLQSAKDDHSTQESHFEADPARGIIGKFGVGFYSAFMIGERVQVRSKAAVKSEDPAPLVWESEGTGRYTISDLDPSIRQERGTSVVIYLSEENWKYCDETTLEGILKRYSNFVNFPIYLNGKRVNTLEALWAKDPKEVEYEDYAAFYKYIANAVDDPLDVYHFRVDAPLDVKALLIIPSFHSEKYGMGRMEPGVALYSRKVLIEAKSQDILPDWMRFVRGVVDSEDLPLQISRSKPQDSALIAKLRRALCRKFITHLTKMEKSKYLDEFYKEYSFFLKEGICQDYEFQAPLSKLLYFSTNKSEQDLISLDDYIANMRPEQSDIYYLVAPSRHAATHSPYLEAFEKANVQVLLLYTAVDDFVMANLEQYEGRKLVSVEKGDIDLSKLTGDDDDDKKDTMDDDNLYKASRKLDATECLDFCKWFQEEALGKDKVASCTVTTRLSTSPAIVTDTESGAMRRMMRLVDTDGSRGRDGVPLPKQHVEINPQHKLIVGIYDLHKNAATAPLARVLAQQVFDNCLVGAGLLDDPRSMIPRLNDILLCVVNQQEEAATSSEEEEKEKEASPSEEEEKKTE